MNQSWGGDFSHNFVGGFTVSPFGPTAVPSREPFFIYNIHLSKPLKKREKKTSSITIHSQAWDSPKKTRNLWLRIFVSTWPTSTRQFCWLTLFGDGEWVYVTRLANGWKGWPPTIGDKLRYVFETTWSFSALFWKKSALFLGWVGFFLPKSFPSKNFGQKPKSPNQRWYQEGSITTAVVIVTSSRKVSTKKKQRVFSPPKKMRGKNTPQNGHSAGKIRGPFLEFGFMNTADPRKVTKPN